MTTTRRLPVTEAEMIGIYETHAELRALSAAVANNWEPPVEFGGDAEGADRVILESES